VGGFFYPARVGPDFLLIFCVSCLKRPTPKIVFLVPVVKTDVTKKNESPFLISVGIIDRHYKKTSVTINRFSTGDLFEDSEDCSDRAAIRTLNDISTQQIN
jgi:hypothetical protein